jgi:hypothetical protein
MLEHVRALLTCRSVGREPKPMAGRRDERLEATRRGLLKVEEAHEKLAADWRRRS